MSNEEETNLNGKEVAPRKNLTRPRNLAATRLKNLQLHLQTQQRIAESIRNSNPQPESHVIASFKIKRKKSPQEKLPSKGKNSAQKRLEVFKKRRLSSDRTILTEETPMDWESIVDEEIESLRETLIPKEKTPQSFFVNEEDIRLIWVDDVDSAHSRLNELVCVVDTNVLIHDLSAFRRLLDKTYRAGRLIMIIPFMVLQELDLLIARNNRVSSAAKTAVDFLRMQLQQQAGSIRVQSQEDHQRNIIEISSPDDNILNCCLHMVEKNKKTILLSGDNNLRNKAFASGIEAFTISEMSSDESRLNSVGA